TRRKQRRKGPIERVLEAFFADDRLGWAVRKASKVAIDGVPDGFPKPVDVDTVVEPGPTAVGAEAERQEDAGHGFGRNGRLEVEEAVVVREVRKGLGDHAPQGPMAGDALH